MPGAMKTVTTGSTLTFEPRDIKISELNKPLQTAASYLRWTLREDSSGVQPILQSFLALFIQDPITMELTEVSTTDNDSNYARQEINWETVGVDDSSYNTNDIAFTPANLVGTSATNGVHVISHFGVYDAITGGTLVYQDEIFSGSDISVIQDTVIEFAGNLDLIWIGEA